MCNLILETEKRFRLDGIIEFVLVVSVLYQMAYLGKNQPGAGQFAGIEAARHAKYNGAADDTGSGAGHDGGGINLIHAEFGKQRTKCAQFFRKERADSFDGHIFFGNPSAAGYKNHRGV